MKKHMIVTRISALVAAAMLVATATDAAAACAPDAATVREWAFAKLGPVPVFGQPGAGQPIGLMRTEFSKPYPVIDKKGRREIRICIDGREAWVRKSDFLTTYRRAWIQTGDVMRVTDRPRLEFWGSPDRLRVYVGGETEIAQPDYREFAGNSVSRPVAFPVIRFDFVKMQVGHRDVEFASVLVPFPREAVEAYETIRRTGQVPGAAPELRAGLVVDISGSTEGLVEEPIRNLVESLKTYPHLSGLRIVSAGFGGDGEITGFKERAIADAALANWPIRVAADPQNARHDVAEAIEYVQRTGGADAPLVILAGGDIGLDKKTLSAFPAVIVGQITPELQQELEATARMSGAEFTGFATNLGAAIADQLAGRMAKPEKGVPDEADFAVVASLMRSNGMLPIIPHDIETRERLAIPPAGENEPAWFTVELFLVVRDDLLDRREE